MTDGRAGRWFIPRRPRVLVPVLVGAITLAALLVWAAYGAGQRVVGGAAFCSSCHADDLDHLRSPLHRDLACSACHKSELGPGLRQYLLTKLKGAGARVPHGEFQPASCRECHAGAELDRKIFAEIGGHSTHVLEAGQACSECHGAKVHVESIEWGACTGCHADVPMFASAVQGASCTSCHAFSSRGRPSRTLSAPECAACHHPPDTQLSPLAAAPAVTSNMIHGEVGACGLCHDPHAAAPSERDGGFDCRQCHFNVVKKIQAGPQVEAHSGCETCHAPHAQRSELAFLCEGCHTEQSSAAMPEALASQHKDCAECHSDHRFVLARDDCARCHAKEASVLSSWEPVKHANCLNCHKPHVNQSVYASCKECHPAQQGHGHEDCSTCHVPHESKKAVPACGSCHAANVRAIASSKASRGHANCLSCHSPHAAGVGRACSSCHAKESSLASTAPVARHRDCSSCHKPHTFPASMAVCASCHQTRGLGAHDENCQSCHQPHGRSVPAQLDCARCHAQIKQDRGKHSDCTSCHAVHAPKNGGPACVACHKSEVAGAASWPNPEHSQCASCHTLHAVATPRACGSCHGPESKQFGPSKHECETCHNPHQPPKAWWAGCASCHRRESSAAAGRGPKHSNCSTCHKPHEPAALPTCQSCHQSLGGGHRFKPHQKCDACHDTHAREYPSRKDCLACHQDMTNHFPTARRCEACHPFK